MSEDPRKRRGPIGVVGDWFRYHRDLAVVGLLMLIAWIALGVFLLYVAHVSRGNSGWIDD